MPIEEWRKVPEFEGYRVSSLGRIMSFRRRKTRILSSRSTNTQGYIYVLFWVNGKSVCRYVHRVVASAFIPNPENKKCVNHIDGDIKNNLAINLEWSTHSENSKHSYRTGRQSKIKSKSRTRYLSTIDITGQKWGFIKGFGTRYKISDSGEVVSLLGKPKLLYSSKDKQGYQRINLFLDGKQYCRFIHRLVAEVFLANPATKPFVNHKDSDKGNNAVSNLEWVTESENSKYIFSKCCTKCEEIGRKI